MVVAALVLGTALWVITPAPAHAAALGLGWTPSWEGAWSWLVRLVLPEARWEKEGGMIDPDGGLAKEGGAINPNGGSNPVPPLVGPQRRKRGVPSTLTASGNFLAGDPSPPRPSSPGGEEGANQ